MFCLCFPPQGLAAALSLNWVIFYLLQLYCMTFQFITRIFSFYVPMGAGKGASSSSPRPCFTLRLKAQHCFKWGLCIFAGAAVALIAWDCDLCHWEFPFGAGAWNQSGLLLETLQNSVPSVQTLHTADEVVMYKIRFSHIMRQLCWIFWGSLCTVKSRPNNIFNIFFYAKVIDLSLLAQLRKHHYVPDSVLQ